MQADHWKKFGSISQELWSIFNFWNITYSRACDFFEFLKITCSKITDGLKIEYVSKLLWIKNFYGSKTFLYGLLAIKILRWLRTTNKFPKIFNFSGKYTTLKFWIFSFNFSKIAWAKNFEISFYGLFLTLKIMITKFLQNSNFSDFLGIKSEISHCSTVIWVIFRIN